MPGVLAFIDSGRDVLIATDHTASQAVRELAMECGVDFLDVTSPVRPLRSLNLKGLRWSVWWRALNT